MQKPAAEGEEQIVGGCLGWMSSQVCCGRAARRRGGGHVRLSWGRKQSEERRDSARLSAGRCVHVRAHEHCNTSCGEGGAGLKLTQQRNTKSGAHWLSGSLKKKKKEHACWGEPRQRSRGSDVGQRLLGWGEGLKMGMNAPKNGRMIKRLR